MSDRSTVFLVDDDASIRKTLPLAIARRSYEVKAFESAEAFLESYDGHTPGCVVLDLSMPKMNGLSLQEEMNRRQWTLPIIFLSGFGTVETVAKAMKAGAVYFYEKPIEPPQLVKCIREALALDQANRRKQTRQLEVEERISRLTRRQRQVMELVVKGMTSKQIADKLGRSIKTVEVHRSQILGRMEVQGVAELINLVLGPR